MKKYNIANYVRYKEDVKTSIINLGGREWDEYTRNELIVKFMPLVENLARKFSTTQQASGVLSINDLIQEGNSGLIKAIDRLDWDQLTLSSDIEKTLKSFLSKRIKGAIRRAIDINRGDIKIPEHKLNEIRKNPEDDKKVALFFNSIFTSYDIIPENGDNFVYQLSDDSEDYNIDLMNSYLLGLMKENLTQKQYDVLRLSYGLDCDKHAAKDIAAYMNLKVPTANVIVSQIKKEAIDRLISSVDATQVIDYL
jgi:RNA polymerase sigma factor (sigma-70 family)